MLETSTRRRDREGSERVLSSDELEALVNHTIEFSFSGISTRKGIVLKGEGEFYFLFGQNEYSYKVPITNNLVKVRIKVEKENKIVYTFSEKPAFVYVLDKP